VWTVLTRYHGTYNENTDGFGAWRVPSKAGVVWLLGPALALALLLHPSLNGNWLTDSAWAGSQYLEAVAILPQLWLLQRRGGEVDELVANCIFLLGAARVFHFVFWAFSFHELNDRTGGSFRGAYPGYVVILSQAVHLLITGQFFYLFLASAKRGRPMRLPLPT
jgi:hypothetical protein